MSAQGEDETDNKYSAINMGHDDDFETASPKDVELKEVKGGDSNGYHSNTPASKDTGASKSGKNAPFLPKIFIALLIVLLIAVIALCFVLYNLDKQVTKTDGKSSKLTASVKTITDGKAELDEQIKKLGSKVFQVEHVLNRIDQVNASTADLKSSLIALQKWQKEAKTELGKKDELITKLQGLLNIAQTGIDEEKKTVVDLTKVVNTNKDTIKEKSDLITGLQKESAKSADEIKDVNTYADQLRMKIQFDDKMEKELQLDFKKIVELAGMKDRVSQIDPTLKKLQDQKTSFEEANKKWKITYNDILRLISEEDFKQKELPVVKKIGTMFDLFTNTYNKKWSIEFKDVIKFTQKSDLTDMDIAGNKYLFNAAPKVLLKIDYLYNTFDKTYKPKWHILFKDVFSVTANLDFEVGATDIPVLKMIGSWFVENFNEIWGEKTFEDLFHELVKSSEDERKDIVAKLGKIAQKNSLHFLPADFEKNDKIVTISGFVKVLVNEVWGTIYKKGFKIDNLATVVCVQSGYKDGKDLKVYPQTGSYDRTNVTRLVRSAACYGNEKSINECGQLKFDNTTTAWNQTDDLAIKCTL